MRSHAHFAKLAVPLLRDTAMLDRIDTQCPERHESNLVNRNPEEAAHAECVHRAQSILEQVCGVAEKSSVKDSVPADWA